MQSCDSYSRSTKHATTDCQKSVATLESLWKGINREKESDERKYLTRLSHMSTACLKYSATSMSCYAFNVNAEKSCQDRYRPLNTCSHGEDETKKHWSGVYDLPQMLLERRTRIFLASQAHERCEDIKVVARKVDVHGFLYCSLLQMASR